MDQIELRLSPAIAGFLNYPTEGLVLPLPTDQPLTLRAALLHLEEGASGTLLDPRTGHLRRHIHVYHNRRLVADLDRPLSAGDVVDVDLRMLEGGCSNDSIE